MLIVQRSAGVCLIVMLRDREFSSSDTFTSQTSTNFSRDRFGNITHRSWAAMPLGFSSDGFSDHGRPMLRRTDRQTDRQPASQPPTHPPTHQPTHPTNQPTNQNSAHHPRSARPPPAHRPQESDRKVDLCYGSAIHVVSCDSLFAALELSAVSP